MMCHCFVTELTIICTFSCSSPDFRSNFVLSIITNRENDVTTIKKFYYGSFNNFPEQTDGPSVQSS